MAAIEKVKVLVVGDSGVGKTSLTHLIAYNEPIGNPSWTVGCSVEVKLHEFREGTNLQKTYFVELWDIGGSSSHRETRDVFYNNAHGVILVHDLTNRKSLDNLNNWFNEVMNKDGLKSIQVFDEFDTEQFAGSNMLPTIVIGTKLDMAGEKRVDFANEWGADQINLDCMDVRSLAPGSSSAMKLTRFFDKVIEVKYHRQDMFASRLINTDKRRFLPKMYHND